VDIVALKTLMNHSNISTTAVGAKKVLKDFKSLIGTLQALIRKHGKGDAKGLQRAYKAVRTSVSVK